MPDTNINQSHSFLTQENMSSGTRTKLMRKTRYIFID